MIDSKRPKEFKVPSPFTPFEVLCVEDQDQKPASTPAGNYGNV
jgi:hypothetical protein